MLYVLIGNRLKVTMSPVHNYQYSKKFEGTVKHHRIYIGHLKQVHPWIQHIEYTSTSNMVDKGR